MVGEEPEAMPYGYEEYEEYNWKSLVKRILKYVVIIAVIAAIGWLLYDHFIGSYMDAGISIQNLEGKPVGNNGIELREVGTGTIVFEDSGIASYKPRIKRGTYSIRINASGYKPFSKQVSFNEEHKSETVKLVKDIDVEIAGLEMPVQLFASQEFDLIVSLENEGKSREEVEFKFGGDFSEFNCRAVDKPVSLAGGELADFNVKCRVPSKTGLEKAVKGEDKEGSVGIMYTLESMEKEFTLYPQPLLILPKEVGFYAMDPSDPDDAKKQEDLQVNNRSRFPLYNTRLRIEISSAEKNGIENVKGWVYFTNAAGANKNEILVEQIGERQKHNEPIEVSIPIDAIEEEIFGSIVIEAPFLEAPRRVNLSIQVSKSASASLKLGFDPLQNIKYSNGSMQEKTETIAVENSGDLEIENIDLYVQNLGVCTPNWLSFTSTSSIERIEAGDEKNVYITVSAPTTAGVGDSAACVIKYTYTHPLTGKLVDEEAGVIEVRRTG